MMLKVAIFVALATLCYAGVPKIIGKARPCALNDYKCIRANLAANSKCNLRTRPVRRTYTVPKHRFEAPNFNASYIDHNLQVTGQDRCYVSEFYYNVNSDTGVLGVDCPYLNFASDRTMYQHNPLQEDSIYHYRINGTYPMIRLTTSMDNADVMDLCVEFTAAFVAALPWFYIDPKDKPTANFLNKDLSYLGTFEKETFLYRADLLIREFVNTQLCDFGCN